VSREGVAFRQTCGRHLRCATATGTPQLQRLLLYSSVYLALLRAGLVNCVFMWASFRVLTLSPLSVKSMQPYSLVIRHLSFVILMPLVSMKLSILLATLFTAAVVVAAEEEKPEKAPMNSANEVAVI